jgi:hypothetical protein
VLAELRLGQEPPDAEVDDVEAVAKRVVVPQRLAGDLTDGVV